MSTYIRDLIVNGQEVHAIFEQEKVENCYLPFLKELTALQKKNKRRIIAFIAGAPGSGKTTLSYFLEQLSKENDDLIDCQAIGIDGYHYYQDYLNTHYINLCGEQELLAKYKGASFTFDVETFMTKLDLLTKQEVVYWPLYSRVLHNPEEDKIEVKEKIILIEGNYLLANQAPWSNAYKYCDLSAYVDVKEEDVASRLIERKMKGGVKKEDAIAFYEKSDGRNVKEVISNHKTADYLF